MRTSIPRLFARSGIARSLLSTPTPAAASCPGAPVGAGNSTLEPVRYHIFKQPLPYKVGLKLQNDVVEARLNARKTDPKAGKHDVFFLLEHTPVYTTGRRDNNPDPDKLHPEEEKVVNVGAEFVIIKRGGQVTFHGPGQLVGYPILDLNAMGTPTRCYVEYMERLLRDYPRDLGLDVVAPHPDGHVGVFASSTEKLSSIGIHLRHRITSHGFSFNVTNEPLAWFDLVTACGLDDVRAVSLHQLLSRLPNPPAAESLPSVQDVAREMVNRFSDTFQREFVPLANEGDAEVEALRALVRNAEAEAEAINAAAGGWESAPVRK